MVTSMMNIPYNMPDKVHLSVTTWFSQSNKTTLYNTIRHGVIIILQYVYTIPRKACVLVLSLFKHNRGILYYLIYRRVLHENRFSKAYIIFELSIDTRAHGKRTVIFIIIVVVVKYNINGAAAAVI